MEQNILGLKLSGLESCDPSPKICNFEFGPLGLDPPRRYSFSWVGGMWNPSWPKQISGAVFASLSPILT
jgi:hypothetical protein